MRASALVRSIVDLLLTVTFIVIAITGIGLYLAPSGRIAHTVNWTFLGMDKDTLTLIHTYFGFVMIALVAVHLVIGFRSMLIMLKSALRSSKLKVVAALLVPLLLIAGGYSVFAAYSGEEEEQSTGLEEYNTTEGVEGVYITGTMMKYYTVQELADEFHVPVDGLIEKLKERGIEATPDESLAEIEYKYDLDREEFKAMLEEIIAELGGGGS